MDPESKLCANNCGFFGSSVTNNLCSKCYKDSFLAAKISILDTKAAATATATDAAPRIEKEIEGGPGTSGEYKKPAASRCRLCNKKVGLMGFSCRCGGVFCVMHRYSDKHGCEFDYRREGKDAIEKANPIVKADKVEKI